MVKTKGREMESLDEVVNYGNKLLTEFMVKYPEGVREEDAGLRDALREIYFGFRNIGISHDEAKEKYESGLEEAEQGRYRKALEEFGFREESRGDLF